VTNRDKIVRYAIVRREEKRDVAKVQGFSWRSEPGKPVRPELCVANAECGPSDPAYQDELMVAKIKVRRPYCRAFAARRHSKFDNSLR
jgi:hypothetical protein